MEQKFILIAATGRSGSTTLQRILNTIPESNINGENSGAILDLLRCYKNLKKTLEFMPYINDKFLTTNECEELQIKPAWANVFDLDKVKNDIRQLIINILDNGQNNKVIGFKEIRYVDSIELLDEFKELFPNTKIICHFRQNLDKQCKSDWWAITPDAREHLIRHNEQLINYYNNHKDYCYLFTLEDISSLKKIKQLFEFIDLPWDKNKYKLIIQNKLE